MRLLSNKLSSTHGETIVETLAAILIAALSCTILMTSVIASVQINKQAENAEIAYRKELMEAEIGNGSKTETGQDGPYEGTITIKSKDGSSYSYHVLYTGSSRKLTSYHLDPAKEGTGS